MHGSLLESGHDIKIQRIIFSTLQLQVPSTVGMRRSVETSHLFKIRANDIVPERTEQIVKVRKVPLY